MHATGAQLGKFERGGRYIYDRKDEIVHDLSPSVAPLFRDMPKYEMHEGASTPCLPPPKFCPWSHVESLLF